MRATVGALLALLILASPLAAIAAAQEDRPVRDERDLQVEVSRGLTERAGGGAWVKIQVGTTTFAVIYGTADNPNSPKIFVEYDRYLGAAEIYNETGELLGRHPLPVRTIMVQSFDAMLEFADRDGDGLFHFPRSIGDLLLDEFDLPRKALDLRQTWTLEDFAQVDEGTTTLIDFNVSAYNLPYTMVRPLEDQGDGLDRITFAFHITVDRVLKTLDVNVYEVKIDRERHILEFLGTRMETVTGVVVDGSFKYDHYIEGWDWGGDDSRLALATHVLVGNHVPPKVAQFIRLTFAPHAEDTAARYDENNTLARPKLITADSMLFQDEWERVGRLRWVSDVEVDGVRTTMSFQLHDVMRIARYDVLFGGILFGGAFIYPQGNVIYHDPTLDAAVFVPVTTGAGPFSVLAPYFIQLAVAALAVVGLVVYRVLRRNPQA